jgi:formate dehydrogenase major subunit
VPVKGAEELLEVDHVIIAIGQTMDHQGREGVAFTRRKTIEADEATCLTDLGGVFAIGDAVNKGAGIAIEAIAGAGKAAEMAHRYLNGESLERVTPYLCETEPTAEDYADRQKLPRAKAPCREPGERSKDFGEVSLGLSDEAAQAEAKRCLECGCMDYFDCKLAKLATRYELAPARLMGEKHGYSEPDNGHPMIKRDPAKCILCGLCVRVCAEEAGIEALGLAGRGFSTQALPALNLPLAESGCNDCGLCVNACPTGAIIAALPLEKQVPLGAERRAALCAKGLFGLGDDGLYHLQAK